MRNINPHVQGDSTITSISLENGSWDIIKKNLTVTCNPLHFVIFPGSFELDFIYLFKLVLAGGKMLNR